MKSQYVQTMRNRTLRSLVMRDVVDKLGEDAVPLVLSHWTHVARAWYLKNVVPH